MSDDIEETRLVVDANDVDMDLVADLCEFLHDAFVDELESGTTMSELVLAVGTVLSALSSETGGTMH